jgi:hypothetical protein
MNTEIVVSFGPISFIAIVIQQIFIIYAIYAIFIRPTFKSSSRGYCRSGTTILTPLRATMRLHHPWPVATNPPGGTK